MLFVIVLFCILQFFNAASGLDGESVSFRLFSNSAAKDEQNCGPEGLEIANKCFATAPKVVLQSALLEEPVSFDGVNFKDVKVVRYIATLYNVPLIYGGNALESEVFQLQHIQPRVGDTVSISLGFNPNGNECSNEIEQVWYHEPSKGHLENVTLSHSCTDYSANNSLKLLPNSLGQVSFMIPASNRLLGMPLVNIRTSFMSEDAVYEINPDTSVWDALAKLDAATLNSAMSLQAKPQNSFLIKNIVKTAHSLLEIKGYELGLANSPTRTLHRRRLHFNENAKYQLPGIRTVHDHSKNIVFGRLKLVQRDLGNSLVKRYLVHYDVQTSKVNRILNSAKDKLLKALRALKHGFQILYRTIFYAFGWKAIAYSATAINNHVLGILPEMASMPQDKTTVVLERMDSLRKHNYERMSGYASNVTGQKDRARYNASSQFDGPVKSIKESYVGNLLATYWNGSLSDIEEANTRQLKEMRSHLDQVMEKTVTDPRTARNRSLVEAQQELSAELDHLILQRKMSKVLSSKVSGAKNSMIAFAVKSARSVMNLGFRLMRLVLQVGLSVMSATVKIVMGLFTAHIKIPYITHFFEKVVFCDSPGAKLTLLGLFSLVGAMPYTAVYRALHNGKYPFDEAFLERQQSLAQSNQLLNLVTGDSEAIAELGGASVSHAYNGFFKIALSAIDTIAMNIPMKGVTMDLYFLYIDLLNTPTLPLLADGPIQKLSESVYTLYTYSIIADFYFLYKNRIGPVITPKAWVEKALQTPNEKKAMDWARDTVWQAFRVYFTVAMLAWLFAEVYKLQYTVVKNDRLLKYMVASLALDVQSACFAIFPALLNRAPPVGVSVPSWIGIYPVATIMGLGQQAFENLFRIISNGFRVASGLVLERASFIATEKAMASLDKTITMKPVVPAKPLLEKPMIKQLD